MIALLSGVLHPDVTGTPAPARTDDGNHWITGSCWGWCGRSEARVLWMGPACRRSANYPPPVFM